MILDKYSLGMGDRFGCEGKAQLDALVKAKELGIHVTPVWNKSHREHSIIGSQPADVRREADEAVQSLGWNGSYHVDADHIGLSNVATFLGSCDFFTFDVAESIGKPLDSQIIEAFVDRHRHYAGQFTVAGIAEPFDITEQMITAIATKYLPAVREAGRIYRHINDKKGEGNFIAEISMDETDDPQTPIELFFILAAIAEEKIPAQTLAPKFTGRFNKGVDYVGDVKQFEKEFNEDLAIIAFAIETFSLPNNLKLSLHSGSDKFSIYSSIKHALTKFNAGIHVKTAGTTWLEELIGLAMSEEEMPLCREIYRLALHNIDDLCAPYQSVIDINPAKLPSSEEVNSWSGTQFADALRHDQNCDQYNPDLRQLLHVAFKVPAKMGETFTDALKYSEKIIAEQVTGNLYERHVKQLFPKS